MSCYEKINGEGSLTLVLFKELRSILIKSLTKDINNIIRENEKEYLSDLKDCKNKKEQNVIHKEYKESLKELKEYCPNSRTYEFPIINNGYCLGYILLDKKTKAFSITIPENNHVVDDADKTFVYGSFLSFLNNLPENRKSVNAKIYYENEYHEYGGNTNYYGYNSKKYISIA